MTLIVLFIASILVGLGASQIGRKYGHAWGISLVVLWIVLAAQF